ncbi:MAG: tetratricopeptide repeat protein [Thermodesulfobacteriota bacterium]
MSLIRDALKKGAAEGEIPLNPDPPRDDLKKEALLVRTPLNPPPEKGGQEKKQGWDVRRKKGLAVILLLLLSAGLVAYLLVPDRPASKAKTPPQAPLPKAITPGSRSVEPGSEGENRREGPAGITARDASRGLVVFTAPQATRSKSPSIFVPKSSSSGVKAPKTASTRTLSESGKSSGLGPEKEAESLEVVRLFNEAVLAQQKKRFPQAIQTYQELLALRPSHWETYNNLGLIYQEQQQFGPALKMFQKSLALNPRYLKGMNNLGLLYLQQGEIEEAGGWFRKVLEVEPGFTPALINLAAVLNRQGEPEQAGKVLLKVLEYDAENPEAFYNLGLLWEKQGAEQKALEYYRKFVPRARGSYAPLAEELKRRWPELQ